MEKFKAVTKQIKELDIFEDAVLIAAFLTELDPSLGSLSDEHINTLKWVNTILPAESGEQHSRTIAEATILGAEGIKKTLTEISTLLRIEIEKVYSQIKKNAGVLLVSEEDVNRTFKYLQSIGMSSEQIKVVFFDAVLLDEKSLRERCEIILKYWTVDELVYLAANCGFFSNLPYYDMVEAVTVAVDALGATKAMEFFHFRLSFFVGYRSIHYRKLPTDEFSHKDALKVLDEYKRSNL